MWSNIKIVRRLLAGEDGFERSKSRYLGASITDAEELLGSSAYLLSLILIYSLQDSDDISLVVAKILSSPSWDRALWWGCTTS